MTRIVKPKDLKKPDESLREQMRKLELSLQEGEDTLTQTSPIHKTHSLLYTIITFPCPSTVPNDCDDSTCTCSIGEYKLHALTTCVAKVFVR